MTTELWAWAKINLALHVTGLRDDGYHLLDSLVVFGDVGDRLTLQPGPQLSLSVTGPFAKGVPEDAHNLVWQAAERAGWTGAISLQKNLPHGAGIGGGSSDAAAVLRALGQPDWAAGLGADVPVCLSQHPQRMQGIGEVLTPVSVPALPIVLVNPGVTVPTGAVFSALPCKENRPMGQVPDKGLLHWLAEMRNDLQPAAQQIAPVIGTVLEALNGAKLARMSGSGATCFGIYDTPLAANAAAEKIARAQPDWWVRPATTFS